jgi:hypothetical protein
MLCDARECKTFDGAAALYWDEFHLSGAGARRLAAAFPPLFGKDQRLAERPASNVPPLTQSGEATNQVKPDAAMIEPARVIAGGSPVNAVRLAAPQPLVNTSR